MEDEWAVRNFKGIQAKLEEYVVNDAKREAQIIKLQEQVTMIVQENMVIKQRLNVIQGTQVLGSTSR